MDEGRGQAHRDGPSGAKTGLGSDWFRFDAVWRENYVDRVYLAVTGPGRGGGYEILVVCYSKFRCICKAAEKRWPEAKQAPAALVSACLFFFTG